VLGRSKKKKNQVPQDNEGFPPPREERSGKKSQGVKRNGGISTIREGRIGEQGGFRETKPPDLFSGAEKRKGRTGRKEGNGA